jgi:hypothetical protein
LQGAQNEAAVAVKKACKEDLDELSKFREWNTRGKNKRAVPLSASNRDEWGYAQQKSKALNEDTGLLACLRYWCDGSMVRAQDLRVSGIKALKLE